MFPQSYLKLASFMVYFLCIFESSGLDIPDTKTVFQLLVLFYPWAVVNRAVAFSWEDCALHQSSCERHYKYKWQPWIITFVQWDKHAPNMWTFMLLFKHLNKILGIVGESSLDHLFSSSLFLIPHFLFSCLQVGWIICELAKSLSISSLPPPLASSCFEISPGFLVKCYMIW